MREKRIYIVSTTNADGDRYALDTYDIMNMSNEDFIEEAEAQGWVWSSMESFAEAWNGSYAYLPNPDESEMRII
jgi:hypothetical protein